MIESDNKIIVTCTRCGVKLRLPANRGMLEVKCPKCNNTFRVNSGGKNMFVKVNCLAGPGQIRPLDEGIAYRNYEETYTTYHDGTPAGGRTGYYGEVIAHVNLNTNHIVFMDRRAVKTTKGEIFYIQLVDNSVIWVNLDDFTKIWSSVQHI